MLLQWGDGIRNTGPDDRALRVGRPVGDRTEAFGGATALLKAIPSGAVLKTQATGPVTLSAALVAGGVPSRGLLESVAGELVTRIQHHLAWIRAESQLDQLVLILDEPALTAAARSGFPRPAGVFEVLGEVIDQLDAEVGFHCCGDTDWEALAQLRPAWLSWDVAELGPGFLAGVDEVALALAEGTQLMWGVVPTTAAPLPDENVLLGRYGTAVANLVVAGAPIESLRSRAWFTPACGLAGLSVADAEAVAKMLETVVGEIEHGW